MTSYTIGTITNVKEPRRGTVCIIAENQEKQLFRISNGMKQWTISASQLEAHGWQMVKDAEAAAFDEVQS